MNEQTNTPKPSTPSTSTHDRGDDRRPTGTIPPMPYQESEAEEVSREEIRRAALSNSRFLVVVNRSDSPIILKRVVRKGGEGKDKGKIVSRHRLTLGAACDDDIDPEERKELGYHSPRKKLSRDEWDRFYRENQIAIDGLIRDEILDLQPIG